MAKHRCVANTCRDCKASISSEIGLMKSKLGMVKFGVINLSAGGGKMGHDSRRRLKT